MARRTLSVLLTLAVAIGLVGAFPLPARAVTYVVDTQADGPDASPGDGVCATDTGDCSLRAALQESNASAVDDKIVFDLSGSGVRNLPVRGHDFGPLPAVRDTVFIDGTSQCGSAPCVELDGSPGGARIGFRFVRGSRSSSLRGFVINGFDIGVEIGWDARRVTVAENYIGINGFGGAIVGNDIDGVSVRGDDNFVTDNVLSGNGRHGVRLWRFAARNHVGRNVVGTNPEGTAPLPNAKSGIAVNGPHTSTATTTAGSPDGNTIVRNLVSGNHGTGILLTRFASGNRVGRNVVGLDSDGEKPLGNGAYGIDVRGQLNALERNSVSGNDLDGVLLGPTARTNHVHTNRLGTNADGSSAVRNGGSGLRIDGGAPPTGTPTTSSPPSGDGNAVTDNLISGNAERGIAVFGNGNLLGDNVVGAAADGTTPLGNGSDGVVIGPGAVTNTAGGPSPDDGNLIAFNGGAGVAVATGTPTTSPMAGVPPTSTATAGTATGNEISHNAIHSNGGLGIDLNRDGVSANDPDDADGGGNDTQNHPDIRSTQRRSSSLRVNGTLDSLPDRSFRLEFFSNGTCDPSGHGEGRTFLGEVDVTTNARGKATFSADLPHPPSGEDEITATATELGRGNTSEFSLCAAVRGGHRGSPPGKGSSGGKLA